MNHVFADTFYFLALLNTRDNAHGKVSQFNASFQGKMTTTAWVLTELADALTAPHFRMALSQVINQLRVDPQVDVIECERALFDEGLALFAARLDKEWSLTDCISFIVMQQHGITEALTGDHHFEQAGFLALLN